MHRAQRLELDAQGRSPALLAEALRDALQMTPALLVIKNLPCVPIDRPTPSHWQDNCEAQNDDLFLEISSLIGTVFGYSDLQGGRLIQEIFPIREDAERQVGSGAVKLELHTEDPALEYRADYLGFMCVSNADRVPTLVSVPDLQLLGIEFCERLSRPAFQIRSDRPSPTTGREEVILTTPVLLRDSHDKLRMIYDPVYIVEEVMTPLDREAFSALVALVEHSVTDFLLEAGEIGIIDNYQVAHGRPQYQPRYDGTDRWLKRTQISRDLGAFSHKALVPGRLMP